MSVSAKELTEQEKKLQTLLSGINQKIDKLVEQYEEDLHPNINPFAMIYDDKKMQKVFDSFKIKADRSESLFGKVHRTYLKYFPGDALDLNFVETMLEALKEEDGLSTGEKQSHLLALKYLRSYLVRFDPNPILEETQIVPDGSPSPKEDEKPQKQDQKKKQKQDTPDTQEMPEEYKPHSKDTEKEGGGSKDDQFVHAEVNFATAYFGQKTYATVTRKGFTVHAFEFELPEERDCPNSTKILTIHTKTSEKTTLFLPPGFRPCRPQDPRAKISRNNKGFFELSLSSGLKSVKIPLEPNIEHLSTPPS